MPSAPLPPTEVERLAALNSYELSDTASEEAFDELVTLAARLTGSPLAAVTLIDAKRQWSKALHGLNVTEIPREQAFCAHTILEPQSPLVVEDTMADPRFQDNPLVTGASAIRAYLGVPLVNPEGHALGALCMIDRVTRSFATETVETMRTLARAVSANLELRRMLLRAREAALTDALTGLPNRRAVLEALSKAAAKADPVAVIAVDLDHFKEANDSEGHAAGDTLLRAASSRLRALLRPDDMVGRIGGDEFIILLFGEVDSDGVNAVAQRVSAALHRPVPHGNRMLRLGATLGVAIMPDDFTGPELGMRVADEALVRAKRERRGGIGRAAPEDAIQLLRAASIIRAFDLDAEATVTLSGAAVHLQPIVTLKRGPSAGPKIVAVEALARWMHPDVGMVPPDDLFNAIGPERSARIGHLVRDQALAAFATLRQTGLSEARIALNLSSNEVCRADIALHIAEQVERAGLSLQHVEIEITEEVLLARVSDRTLNQLTSLRGRGARLVLDDFGTGNSGLAQLLRLPLDGVKLDKQFIQRLGVDVRAEEIVRATVSLAHSLSLAVVAEGIETEQQDAMVRALGCDAGQGFLYARPMPPDPLRAWLDDQALQEDPGVTVLRPKAARKAH